MTGEGPPEALGLVLRCDPEGRILQVFRDDLGLGARLAASPDFPDLVDAASREKACIFLRELRENGAVYDWELNLPLDDQIVLLHFSGVSQEEGTFLVVAAPTPAGVAECCDALTSMSNEHTNALRSAMRSLADTERRLTERQDQFDQMTTLNNELSTIQRELSRKNAELSRANAHKNQLLGMAAHDLRNPLGVIQTYSRYLLDEASPALEKEQVEFLEAIHASAEFMLRLVEDLLDVSRIDAGKLELDRSRVDVAALVKRVVGLNRVLVEKKRIEIAFDPPEGGLETWLDAHKIEQVLNNLLTNAAKFSPPASRVEVRLERNEAEVHLSVSDRGQGIPAGELGRLFRPFGRTSVKSTGGEKSTGLGLAIARRIVEGHGGRIWVESEVGLGSTFHVMLPAESGDVAGPDRAESPAPRVETSAAATAVPAAAPARSLRVLVADDEAVSRRMVTRVLERGGHQVIAVDDGPEALRVIEAGGVDAVVLDLEMPGMGGLEVSLAIRDREQREQGARVPILVLSGHDPAQVSARCREAGADGCLAKPVRAPDLLAHLGALAGPG